MVFTFKILNMLKVYLKRFSDFDQNISWSYIQSRVLLVYSPSFNLISTDERDLELHFDIDSAEVSLIILQLLQNVLRQVNYCFINKFTLT